MLEIVPFNKISLFLLFISPGYYFNTKKQNKGSGSHNVASKPEELPLV